ncbi:hypothetical protein V9K67_21605 [Paraflavisolibacter sp. H34]|uniref:hypothetical protein n=1 Tax=Huijunlia imazamoxiresistens TaxID=3127457 RepID=UPI00301B5EA3
MDDIIRNLRREEHAAGHPFMINDPSLPKGQFYHEYPDGRISIEHQVTEDGGSRFEVIRWLASTEAEAVKSKYGLHE